MEEFKGTKGPWHLSGLNGIQSENGTIVAIATKDGVLPKDTVKANAKLIAASPELLKAAQFAVKMIYENSLDNQLPKTLSELENAINKSLSH